MAAIDKTYVTNYEDWKSIIDWCKGKSFTCPNGMVLHPINYCYYPEISKEQVENWLKNQKEIPVMNTTCSIDYFLIKYCPIEVIQNRIKEVYNEEYYNSVKNGTSRFDTFVKKEGGKHIGWIKKPLVRRTFKHYNKYFKKVFKGRYSVQTVDSELWYNKHFDCWLCDNELGYFTSNTADTDCRTIKALIRKVLKWNLPVGTKIRFFGRYTCETGEFIIKK